MTATGPHIPSVGPDAAPNDGGAPRLAAPGDAAAVARLLDAFNREFGSPTPGPEVLAPRLGRLLAGGDVFAVLAGDPPLGVALVTLRPNVWYDGPVALLDELYVVPERRGGGLGTRLLRAVERECLASGAQLLEITVDGEDDGARHFYERHGYVTGNPGQDEPQLYYSRELSGPGGAGAPH